jgi:outer membrane receptor protein involved in Fe transport
MNLAFPHSRPLWAAALLVGAVAAPVAAPSTSLTGQLSDAAGNGLGGVRITVMELGRRTESDGAGRYRIASLPSGSFTLSFSRVGLVPETRRVALAAGEERLDLRMRATGVELAPVQVTASTNATRAQDSPQPISVLEGAALRVSQGTALGDVLEQVPGVRTLSMTTGIGKPVIRGMTHYRVVTLDNGQRTETQAWGHDHSPNVETATADRIEVIKGPSSVLYGSDALGGVINVVAPVVPDAIDGPRFMRGQAIASYNHNIRGADGTLSVEGASGGLGARLALTSRASGNMRTPTGALANTKNRAIAPEAAVAYRGHRGSVSARYAARDERIEIFDDPVTSPGYTGYQLITTHRGAIDVATPLGGGLLQLSGGYERNFRREFANELATTPELGLLVRNWTGFAHLTHPTPGGFNGTFGVSAMSSQFENLGTEILIPQSETRSVAMYVFEQQERGRWTTMFGARLDRRSLSTRGDATIRVPAQTRRYQAITGSAGVLYRVTEPIALVVNVARGFRAPSAPDLFANGFHEGTRAFERGNPDLGVETSLNADLGVRVSTHDVTAEATGYVNRVSDYIYLRPFGTGRGAFDSLRVVQGDARLIGVEGRVAYRPGERVTLQLSGDYVRGDNLTAGVPLTFVPPLRVLYGARYELPSPAGWPSAPYVTASAETNLRQTRIDPRDVAPPGYTIVSLGAGATRLVPRGAITVDLSLRNALNTSYRSFMSRYKEFALAPGRTLVVRVTTPL